MENTVKLKKAPAYRFAAFILMLLAYILIYAGIQLIAALGADIMEAYSVGTGKLSVLSALGSLPMAILAAIAGVLSVKLGGKRVIVIGLLIMALSGGLYILGTDKFYNIVFNKTCARSRNWYGNSYSNGLGMCLVS